MTERQPKEERNEIAIEAGQRMAVFMEDPLVQRWFETQRESMLNDLLSNTLDPQRLHALAFGVRMLDAVKSAMENAVTVGEHIKREAARNA